MRALTAWVDVVMVRSCVDVPAKRQAKGPAGDNVRRHCAAPTPAVPPHRPALLAASSQERRQRCTGRRTHLCCVPNLQHLLPRSTA